MCNGLKNIFWMIEWCRVYMEAEEERRDVMGFFFFFKQKTAYEILAWLEFRRVLFRSKNQNVLIALLKETVVQMAKANGVRWNWHVLRRDNGMFWEKRWSLKWRARGSEDDQKRRERRKWRRRARVLVWRRRMPWIERDGEELERLLLQWGKSGHPRLRG